MQWDELYRIVLVLIIAGILAQQRLVVGVAKAMMAEAS
jgi:hypothetical protein